MIARSLTGATLVVASLAMLSLLTAEGRPTVSHPPTAEASAPSHPTGAPHSETTPTSAGSLPSLASMRIAVPSVGIDLPLGYGDITRDVPREDYAGATPEGVALVFPGSAPIASGGNTYIYAHARTGMFLSLWSVRVNASVIVYVNDRPETRLTYTVVRVVPGVAPSDTSWLDPAGPERLTLQTSTGPSPSDPRFIVVAARDRPPAPTGSTRP